MRELLPPAYDEVSGLPKESHAKTYAHVLRCLLQVGDEGGERQSQSLPVDRKGRLSLAWVAVLSMVRALRLYHFHGVLAQSER